MLTPIIVNLLNLIRTALAALLEFLFALILAVMTAILIALPWLFRVVAMIAWLTAGYMGIQAVQTIYSPFSSSIPLFALQFVVITIMVAWTMSALIEGKQIWGLLIAGGLVAALLSYGATWLIGNWQYANLFFAALPSALFAIGMITISVRLRGKRLTYESR